MVKIRHLLKIAGVLDQGGKYRDSDSISDYMLTIAQSKFKNSDEPENIDEYLAELRSNFIDFLSNIVTKDYINEHGKGTLSPKSLVKYYFDNRDDYENELNGYDLMLGQTEGIMSDNEFIDQLESEHVINEVGAMKREGKD